MPRCTVTTRIAAAMFAFTMSWTARAASTTSMPSGRATARRARRVAASGDSVHAAGEARGVEVPEQEVGVGDGRLGAAPSVARGPGHRRRPTAARPGARRRRRRQAMLPPPAPTSARSTAGIFTGKPVPARVPPKLPLPPTWKSWVTARPAVAHDADLGGGAAHVERDDVVARR